MPYPFLYPIGVTAVLIATGVRLISWLPIWARLLVAMLIFALVVAELYALTVPVV